MQVLVSGKHVAVGEALRERVTDEITGSIGKYFERGGDADVVVSREGHSFRVDCAVKLASGQALQSHGLGSDAHGAFDAALAKLQARDAKNALAAFETFLRQYPNDAQVPAAHFWAGTAALQLKQYETARRHFARVVYDTPKHELAPDAMLGLANALQGMGDEVGATDMLKRLVERHPNTPAGQVAGQRLGR